MIYPFVAERWQIRQLYIFTVQIYAPVFVIFLVMINELMYESSSNKVFKLLLILSNSTSRKSRRVHFRDNFQMFLVV